MTKIKVIVRSRPFNKVELLRNASCCIDVCPPSRTIVHKLENNGEERNYEFNLDKCYWSENGILPGASQQEIFEDTGQQMLETVFSGINMCVVAYGQTGTGKTYTMSGDSDDPGLIPRMCDAIYNHYSENTFCSIEASYLEIYNEKVRDLLSDSQEPLKIREHPREGVIIQGLSKYIITSPETLHTLIQKAAKHRVTAATCQNSQSSRSHAALLLKLESPTSLQQLWCVDLAGSERTRLKDGTAINRSLTCLTRVLDALASGASHVPCRDSVLTRLLRDALLCGKTYILATVGPAAPSETLATLRFAARARCVVTRGGSSIHKKPNTGSSSVEITRLRNEVVQLRALLCKSPTYSTLSLDDADSGIFSMGAEGGVENQSVQTIDVISPHCSHDTAEVSVQTDGIDCVLFQMDYVRDLWNHLEAFEAEFNRDVNQSKNEVMRRLVDWNGDVALTYPEADDSEEWQLARSDDSQPHSMSAMSDQLISNRERILVNISAISSSDRANIMSQEMWSLRNDACQDQLAWFDHTNHSMSQLFAKHKIVLLEIEKFIRSLMSQLDDVRQ